VSEQQPNIDEILAIHQANFGSARMTETPPEGTPPPPTTTPPSSTDEKLLPQSKVNEIVASRTAEAKAKAMEDLAKDLGVPLEEAKRIVKERQESDEKNQTEIEKERKLRVDAETDRDSKVSTAATELHAERSDRALIGAGAEDDDGKLERLRGMLTVKVGASKEDIKKDVEKLKTDFPALFEASTGTPPPRVPRTTDPPKGPGRTTTSDAMQRGRERAEKDFNQSGGVPRPTIPGLPVTTTS
jgi:hypothetical protein